MKIGQLDPKAALAQTPTERKPAAKGGEAAATQPGGASAQVALSNTASALASDGADPSFDAAKVERIAQAIRDGKFEINPEAIADKLIANAQELLGRNQR